MTANRSVLGIMNEFTYLAETFRGGTPVSDLLGLAMRLATTPCGPSTANTSAPTANCTRCCAPSHLRADPGHGPDGRHCGGPAGEPVQGWCRVVPFRVGWAAFPSRPVLIRAEKIVRPVSAASARQRQLPGTRPASVPRRVPAGQFIDSWFIRYATHRICGTQAMIFSGAPGNSHGSRSGGVSGQLRGAGCGRAAMIGGSGAG
jgi:hypothetical protein